MGSACKALRGGEGDKKELREPLAAVMDEGRVTSARPHTHCQPRVSDPSDFKTPQCFQILFLKKKRKKDGVQLSSRPPEPGLPGPQVRSLKPGGWHVPWHVPETLVSMSAQFGRWRVAGATFTGGGGRAERATGPEGCVLHSWDPPHPSSMVRNQAAGPQSSDWARRADRQGRPQRPRGHDAG